MAANERPAEPDTRVRRRPDPLTDIVLRPTTGESYRSPAPSRFDEDSLGDSGRDTGPFGVSTGTHGLVPETVPHRPGNAMARSRAAILLGAARAVEVSGTAVSMTQIAAAAGVAKATVYNHFRSREELLSALLLDQIDQLISDIAPLELSQALRRAALALSEHPLLESLGGDDTATLAILSRVDVRSAGWLRVAEAVEALLARSGRRGTPTVLRWLASFITAPADIVDISEDIDVLVAGLPMRATR